MSGNFSFSFAGEDIEDDGRQLDSATPGGDGGTQSPAPAASAFPVAGKPLLPAAQLDLSQMLSQLPSKVAYDLLEVDLDGDGPIKLPRRELWDVRVQLMAEEADGGESEPGLGTHDVKTGVYEGGFKSWESSVDLVKVLAAVASFLVTDHGSIDVIELGCGTALPSLALFQWAAETRSIDGKHPLSLTLADYNATVQQLVTLPNFILSWALSQRTHLPLLQDALASEGELDLSPEVLHAFQDFLVTRRIRLSFLSGAWSPEFVDLVNASRPAVTGDQLQNTTFVLGAETIYSPFALDSFTRVVFSILQHRQKEGDAAEALVGAKKLYFGVGGSLDDFVTKARALGAIVTQLREETEGVRRGVVRVALNTQT